VSLAGIQFQQDSVNMPQKFVEKLRKNQTWNYVFYFLIIAQDFFQANK
jgi:hypothetical protein